MSISTRPPYGTTAFGKPTNAATPSVSYAQDNAGHHWAMWFDTSGVLRTAMSSVVEAPGFNWNTGGAPVGAQLLAEEDTVAETPATPAEKKAAAKKSA